MALRIDSSIYGLLALWFMLFIATAAPAQAQAAGEEDLAATRVIHSADALQPQKSYIEVVPGSNSPHQDTLLLEVSNGMVLVPDGTYIMGLTDEDPLQLQTAGLRRITVSSFYIDQLEVTNASYRRFLEDMPKEARASLMPDTTIEKRVGNRYSLTEYFEGSTFDDYPVVGVTHMQAQQYCGFYGKRLPTEAEWEYAARSGELGGVYPWVGLEARDEQGEYLANFNPGRGGYAADGYAFTAPVKAFMASKWGLFNMSGNVAEWCEDAYQQSYSGHDDFNPLYIDPNEELHVVRGGSWASDAFYIGVGVRDAQPTDEATTYIGFRCVMDISLQN